MSIQKYQNNTLEEFRRLSEIVDKSWSTKEEYLQYRAAWRGSYRILSLAIRKAREHRRILARNHGTHPAGKKTDSLLATQIFKLEGRSILCVLANAKEAATREIAGYHSNKERAGMARLKDLELTRAKAQTPPVQESVA